MTHRSPGMDHAHYPFSPIDRRPPLVWPGDERLAWTVFLYLEAWEVDPPKDAVTDPRMKDSVAPFFPDYRTSTRMEYGNRVQLRFVNGWLVVFGDESGGKYIEVLDPKNGRRLSNRMVRT